MAIKVSESNNHTLTISISDPNDVYTYTVEHQSDDSSIYLFEKNDICMKVAFSASPAIARAIASALLKCADKAEGKVVNHDPTIATDAARYVVIADRLAALENGHADPSCESEHDDIVKEMAKTSERHGDLWAEAYLQLHPQGGK
jgi:hypothetical protein